MSKDDDFTVIPFHEIFYILSMLRCTESALISAEWVAAYLQAHFKEMPTTIKVAAYLPEHTKISGELTREALLNHLQNIALQAAAISRFFWPSNKKYHKRGAFLRQRFNVSDSNPLKSRKLRNRMEHYDECLDDYCKHAEATAVSPDYIGKEFKSMTVRPIGDEDDDDKEWAVHLLRAYFVDTGRVEILGVRFELQPIVDEIARLHTILKKYKDIGEFPPHEEANQ